MKPSDMMSIEHTQAQMWQLSAERRSLRMELPSLSVDGLPAPIRVQMVRVMRIVEGRRMPPSTLSINRDAQAFL